MDLHLHTPASTDYQLAGVSAIDILHRAEEAGLDIIAFTDHNSVRGYADLWREIEDLELLEFLNRANAAEAERLAEYRRLLSKILLLPGFEFTATFGFHVLAIFPETTSIRLMEHLLLLLGVPEDRFGSGEVGATSDVLRAYEVLADNGALVIGAHVNSSHGVAMQGIRFGGQTKIAYTQDEHLHALEVTDLMSTSRRSTAYFFSGAKPEYSRKMHCIQGSDAHRLERDPARETNLGIGDRATEVQLPEPSFAALMSLFKSSDFSRTRAARPGGPAADALHEARETGATRVQSFHERLAQARGGSTPILRDVVGFSNSGGGMIYVGVGPSDRRTVPGVADAPQAIEAWRADIDAQITPRPEIAIETIDYGGKTVVAIRVSEGHDKPYALAPGMILVRHAAETEVATRDEIVAMVRGGSFVRPATEPMRPSASVEPAEAEPSAPEPADQHERDKRRRHQPVAVHPKSVSVPTAELAPNEPSPSIQPPVEETWSDGIAPRSGAEVVNSFEGDGVTYYSIRDLRNGAVTHNVTRENARRLWQYAIQQREAKDLDEGHIRWKGDYGFWKVYRPSRGERRYNLAHRADGRIRVFYGVGDEGLDERWRNVIPTARTAEE